MQVYEADICKNVKNNDICYNIFKHMLNSTLKNNTKSFMKDFENICKDSNLSKQQVVENINTITKQFKEDCLYYDLDMEHELIVMCLKNNHDINMITQLNLVTYAGPLYNKDNL